MKKPSRLPWRLFSARIIFAVVVHFLSEADEAEVDDEKNEKNEIASAKAVEKLQTSG